MLATQEAESRRLGQMFFGKHRELKVRTKTPLISRIFILFFCSVNYRWLD